MLVWRTTIEHIWRKERHAKPKIIKKVQTYLDKTPTFSRKPASINSSQAFKKARKIWSQNPKRQAYSS